MIIPKHIQLESTNGICTSRCEMCTIKSWTRKPDVMSLDVFVKILEKFKPYISQVQYLTLHGCGEPLLDKGLAKKVEIAKSMGFKGTGFATNCTELSEKVSKDLIKAGLDTIICSIDGIKKETHETIRVGTNFEKVVKNVQNFIKLRNNYGKTRVLVRFIRQELNKAEWPLFSKYWSEQLVKEYGDDVVKFDIHNWGGDLKDYESKDLNKDIPKEYLICGGIFERVKIYSNGDIALCDADDNGFFKMGNAIHFNPIEIYNNEIFNHHRKMMQDGRIRELEYCRNCTIPRSRYLKNRN